MNYGKDSENIAKQTNDADAIKNQILSELKEKAEEKPEPKKQLYLNIKNSFYLIKILSNILQKVTTPIMEQKQKCTANFMRFWTRKEIKDSIASMKELTLFVLIHGSLGTPVLLSMLLIANSDLPVVLAIKSSVELTLMVFVIGTGAGYYFFEDVNKILRDNWKRRIR